MRYNRQAGAYAEIPNAAGDLNNIGISRADGSTRYTQTGASATPVFTNASVDAATTTLSGVQAGDTSINLQIGTSGDSYLLRSAVLSVPTASLTIAKSLDGTIGDQYRVATENTRFQITVSNTGSVALTNVVVTDPDNPDCRRTIGTLAVGAVVTFNCTGPPPTQANQVSSATATGTAAGNSAVSVTSTGTTNVHLSAIALTKTGALPSGSTGAVGDVVTYTFTARNTGGGTLTGVSITDTSLPGLSGLTYGAWPSGTAGTLGEGQSVTATATFALTQAVIDAASISNTAQVVGTDADGGPQPTASATARTAVPANPALALTKTGALPAGSTGRAGDVVGFSFVLRNSGNQTITGATITDAVAGVSAISYGTWPSGTAGRLAPGQQVTATATYTLTQADVDRGTVPNTATARGSSPSGAAVTSNTASTTVAVAAAPALATTKRAALPAGAAGVAGDVVTYTVTLSNTGNQTLTGVAASDPLAGLSAFRYGTWPSGTAGTLRPGDQVTVTATYTVTQSDVDAGSVVNRASGTGTPPSGASVSSAGTATLPLSTGSSLSLTKTGALAAGATGRAGDVVTWTFTAANTGAVTLRGVTITDDVAGVGPITYGTWPNGTTGTLAPGQRVTATAPYTLTQADVDAARVQNTASVQGTPPSGPAVRQTATGTVDVAAASNVSLTKSGALAQGATGRVGDVVTWSFTVRNTGASTLDAVTITDPLVADRVTFGTWPSGTSGRLAPGQQVTATASYALTQADVDAGSVVNTATATGTPANGQRASSNAAATVPVASSPALSVAKSGVLASGAQGRAGDRVDYSFTVRNSGNVSLTGVALTDPLPGLSAVAYGTWPSGTSGTLAPGQQVTATARYALTQADVDRGSVANTATASGTPPTGGAVRASGSALVTVAPAPAVALTKSVAGTAARAGDVLTYTFTATNTGNQTLTSVSVADPLPGLSAPAYGTWPSGTAGTLAPGQRVTATATYAVTQADVDAGSVVNTATASGRTPALGTVQGQGSATAPISAPGSLGVTKTGTLAAGATGAAGDVVTYSFRVVNTGAVTLRGVAVSDPLAGLSAVSYGSWASGTAGTLAPGQAVTATATYRLTQADADRGSVVNTATASGRTPQNALVTQGATATTAVPQTAGLAVAKSGALRAGSTGAAGDVADFTIRVTNTGTVTVGSVTLSDSLAGLSDPVLTWPGTPGQLAPGQTLVARASAALTQADVDAGSVVNTATARGTAPGGQATTASGAATVPITSSPALALTKQVAPVAGGSAGRAGDALEYRFSATNRGTVTLTGVAVTDPLAGLGALSYTWPGAAGRLAPGETVTATARYVVTQADADAGSVANRATVRGTTPQGVQTSAEATAVQPIASAPAIALDKTAVVAGSGSVGSRVTYRFDVTNTGSQTVSGVTVEDRLPGLSAISYGTWPGAVSGQLAPGQTVRATATYVLTQADVDAGSVANRATASSTGPSGTAATASDAETVRTAVGTQAIGLTKTETLRGTAAGDVGDTVDLGYVITNTGTTTLTGVSVSDQQPRATAVVYGAWPGGTAGTLAPGQSVTASSSFTLVQADVDAGQVGSRATAVGTSPRGAVVRADADGQVTTRQAPGVQLTKTGAVAAGGAGAVGDTVEWRFVLENTGTVTLSGAAITDALPGITTPVVTWPGEPGALAPGARATATAQSVLTQADVDAGSVVNTARATATAPAPGSQTVTATAAATVATATSAPRLELTKTETVTPPASGPTTANDGAVFTYVVTNTGNVTVSGISILDEQARLSAVTWGSGTSTTVTLRPGESATATGAYRLTQADVDAGRIGSAATASGTASDGRPVQATAAAEAPVTRAPALALAKTAAFDASTTNGQQTDVGETVVYSFLVTNRGNTTLTGVGVADDMAGVTVQLGPWPAAAGTLLPGESVKGTGRHVVTQADVDANDGLLVNRATASASAPDGTTPTAAASASIQLDADAQIGLVKTEVFADPGAAVHRAGDRVSLTFAVTNTGASTLTDVVVTDDQARLGTIGLADGGTWTSESRIAPGETVTFAASYVLTQADVDAGRVRSTASVTARSVDAAGDRVEASDVRSLLVAAAPGYSFEKTGAFAGGAAGRLGDRVDYAFDIVNTGNVTLYLIEVSDPLPGIGAITYTGLGEGRSLAPGSAARGTTSYQVTQADVDRGLVENTATAIANPPAGDAITSTRSFTLATAAQAPSITLDKQELLEGGARGVAGDEVRFSYTVTNTGDTTLRDVALADGQPGLSAIAFGPWPGAERTLAPGQSVTATATYRLTQADVDDGGIASSATVSGTAPGAQGATVSDDADGSVASVRENALVLDKRATATDGSAVESAQLGDTLRYVITARNTGTTTLTGVAIVEALADATPLQYGTWPTAEGTLLPGEAVTATTDRVVTQADVDSGSAVNTATVSGTPPADSGDAPTARASASVVTTSAAPSIRIEKTQALAPDAAGVAGDTVRYSYVVTNTGGVTLTGVTVRDGQARITDAVFGPWPGGAAGTLAPGQSVTATATHVLSQAEVDAGGVSSTATTRGTPPSGARVAGTADARTEVAERPDVAVTKTGALADGARGVVGDRIDYEFVVVNRGNVTLNLLTVRDALAGVGDVRFGEWPGPVGQVGPGEQVRATASYTVTQGDVDAGSVVNQALATATPPSGEPVTGTGVATVALAPTTPAIAVAKTQSLPAGSAGVAGDVVTYSFTVTNTGTATLTGVSLSDAQPGLSDLVVGRWPSTDGVLAPGQSVSATARYVLTQADVDAGVLSSPVTASGTPPQGDPVAGRASASTPLTAAAAVSLDKSVAYADGGSGAVGDAAVYSFTVVNTGAVTLSGVDVADALPGLGTIAWQWPGAAGVLAPGETAAGTASYAVTQQDVDAGSVANRATASAQPARGETVRASDAATLATTSGRPALALTKTEALAPGARGVAGDTVQLSWVVTNPGNQTVSGIQLADDQVGATAPVFGAWPGGTAGRLAPGQSVTATTTYTLTQADVDAGGVTSASHVTGTGPGGTPVRADATAGVTVDQVSTMSFTKAGRLAAGTTGQVGQGVDYTFQVRNTGTVTLSLLDIVDDMPGLSDVTFDRWPGAVGVLAPGERVMGRASYTIRQSDVDAGGAITNTATALATAPDGTVVRRPASATVQAAPQGPVVGLAKEAQLAEGATGRAGDRVEYSFVVTNQGNTTLTGVVLADAQPGLGPITAGPWPGGTAGTLAPGESVRATAVYVLTQADVDRGSVSSVATTSGRSSAPAQTVTASDEKTVVVPPQPALEFAKTVAPATGTAPGDALTYTFTASNTGTVTLDGVVFDDRLVGLSPVVVASWPSGTAGRLAPGQTVTGTATYRVTQADADAGSVVNAASVVASPPTGSPLTATSSATAATAPTAAAIGISKTAALATGAAGVAGDTVEFSYVVTNTGTATLTGVTLTDALTGASPVVFGPWPSPTNRLLPGESVTATARYVLTQADVDAGGVSSSARTTGTTPSGSVVVADATAGVEVSRTASAALVKTAAWTAGGAGRVGDVARFTISVANTGTTTLTDVVVTDPMAASDANPDGVVTPASWPGTPGTLAPGQRVVATVDRVVAQADVDAGALVNVATLTAAGPAGGGDPIVVRDGASLATAATSPAVSIVKTAALEPGAAGVAGDVVRFEYLVTNTGDATLSSVVVTDDQARSSVVSYGAWPGATGVLAPGQTVSATASYVLTQADVDRGVVASRGSVVGTPPSGPAVRASEVQEVPLAGAASLALTKTGALTAGPSGTTGRVGDGVSFAFTITNTGAVTVSGIAVDDRLNGVSAVELGPWPGAAGVLAPRQVVTGTATYAVVQADVDRGAVVNAATASGTAPSGAAVLADARTTVPLTADGPRLGLVKQVALAPGATGRAGDEVVYTWVVTSTGDVTVRDVAVTDAQPGLTTPTLASWTGTGAYAGVLAPGAAATYTARHVLTQAEVDAGVLATQARATGTGDDAAATPVEATDSAPLVLPASPALAVAKTARWADGGSGRVGDVVEYRVSVLNTGSVTLTGVAVSDPLPGLSAVSYEAWPGEAGVLAPGETVVATARYAVTQADVDAGSVVNRATASGVPPTGAEAVASDSATVPTAAAAPRIAVAKTQALPAGTAGVAGDTVPFAFTVTNTGTVTLTGVRLADGQAGLGPVVFGPWPGPVGSLAPGQSVTATAGYVLTQADVDAGAIASTVTAVGTPVRGPGGPADVSATADGRTPLAADAALVLVKTGAVQGRGVAGDLVEWTLTVRNEGRVTLSDVRVTDPLPGLSPLRFGAWPTAEGRLAPGEAVTAVATSRLTQADVDAGAVTNTATASSTRPGGEQLTAAAQATVRTAPAAAALGVTKTQTLADGATGKAGDVVRFGYVVTNTGTVTLRDVVLVDGQPGISRIVFGTWPGEPGVLEPGQSVTATAEYVLTQADVDAGLVASEVTATGTAPGGAEVDDVDDGSVVLPGSSSVSLTKTGVLVGEGAAGEVVRFGFEVVNTGDETLAGIALTDELPGLGQVVFGAWPGAPGVLAPQQGVTATADYVLTQADVDAGLVRNTASVVGTTPGGAQRADQDTAVVTVVPRAALELTKTVAYAPGSTGRVGERLDYAFVVVNTGTVTMTGVGVEDEMPGLGDVRYGEWPGPEGVLAPGESVTATASYTVTAADVAAGEVANTATAIGTGTDPDGTVPPGTTPTRDDDTVVVTTHDPMLAFTGDEAATSALLALVLLVAGLGLALTGRRRDNPRHAARTRGHS
nr:AraC family transcriptional regulator [Frigoribacterium faeni]